MLPVSCKEHSEVVDGVAKDGEELPALQRMLDVPLVTQPAHGHRVLPGHLHSGALVYLRLLYCWGHCVFCVFRLHSLGYHMSVSVRLCSITVELSLETETKYSPIDTGSFGRTASPS